MSDNIFDKIPEAKLTHALSKSMNDLSFNELSTMYLVMNGLNNTQISERLQLTKMAVTKILRRCGEKVGRHM